MLPLGWTTEFSASLTSTLNKPLFALSNTPNIREVGEKLAPGTMQCGPHVAQPSNLQPFRKEKRRRRSTCCTSGRVRAWTLKDFVVHKLDGGSGRICKPIVEGCRVGGVKS